MNGSRLFTATITSLALLVPVAACAEQDKIVESSSSTTADETSLVEDPIESYVADLRAAVDLLPDPIGQVVNDARTIEMKRAVSEIERQLSLDLSTLTQDDVAGALEMGMVAAEEKRSVAGGVLQLENDHVALGRGFDEVSDESLIAWGQDACQAAAKEGRPGVHEWAVSAVAANLAEGVEQAPQALFVEEFDLVASHLCPDWFK